MDDETKEQFTRLFGAVTKGFEAVDARFDSMQQDGVRTKDEMLSNFDALYKRDEERQIEYQAINAALSRVEVSLAELQSSVSRIELANLDTRVSQLESAARGDHDA